MAASPCGFHLLTKPRRPATRETLVGETSARAPPGGAGGGGGSAAPGTRVRGPAPGGAGGARGGPAASTVQASCRAPSLSRTFQFSKRLDLTATLGYSGNICERMGLCVYYLYLFLHRFKETPWMHVSSHPKMKRALSSLYDGSPIIIIIIFSKCMGKKMNGWTTRLFVHPQCLSKCIHLTNKIF